MADLVAVGAFITLILCVQGFLFVSDVDDGTNKQVNQQVNTADQMLAVSQDSVREKKVCLASEWLIYCYADMNVCMSPAGTHCFLPFGWRR